MTHNELIKQSLCKFQFTPTREGSYAIDTNFNLYFIHIRVKNETSINKIGKDLVEVGVLQHSLPFMTFESKVLNKVVTIISNGHSIGTIKLEKLLKTLKDYKWK